MPIAIARFLHLQLRVFNRYPVITDPDGINPMY